MRWMTYREIADFRGIDRSSAMRLVRRHNWQRRPMGDGSALMQVLVPMDQLTPPDPAKPLRDEVVALRHQVEALTKRLDGR